MTEISTSTLSLGVMGVMGNKGALGVRFHFRTHSYCVVCSHLAAGDGSNHFERRCQDASDIQQKLVFTECVRRLPSSTNRDQVPETLLFSPSLLMRNHDRIIFLGDFNFRLSLPKNESRSLAQKKMWNELTLHDELYRFMKASPVLKGYDEGVLTFQPTYKYDMGTNQYDTSHKTRPPAWTDRILWKGTSVRLLVYESVQEIKLSDHRPVRSVLCFSEEDKKAGPVYKLEEKRRGLMDSITDNDLMKNVNSAVKSSADTSADLVGSLFSSVGNAFSGRLSLADLATFGSSKFDLKTFEEESVTPENFASVASCRLDLVLDSESLAWGEETDLGSAKLQAILTNNSEAIMMRGRFTVKAPVSSVASLIFDHSRRSEWDPSLTEGSVIQKYDNHHAVMRQLRRLPAQEDGFSEVDLELGLLQSRHTLPPSSDGGRGGGIAVVLQSVKHRLLPHVENAAYYRAALDFEAYVISPAVEEGMTEIYAYLRLKASGIKRPTLENYGRQLIESARKIGVCLNSESTSASQDPAA